MQPCRLAATDLACRRGDRVLFTQVGFALEPGDVLHIAGANGIGKSSLIRILAGLLRPFAGNVDRAGGIALLDERPALDQNAPLSRALEFWRRIDAQETVDSVLARLKLDELAEVPVRYLSTGQRKRAAMARVLGQQAGVWLLDEPLSGLDESGRALIEVLCAEQVAKGGIIVIASHQPFGLPDIRQLALAEFAA
jgi:heme exporter protein A